MPATRVKTLSFSFFLGIQSLPSLKMIHARPRVVDKLWQQVCSLDFITLNLFLGIFSVWPLLLLRFTIETAFLTHHRTLMKSSSHVLRLSHVHKQKSLVYIHSKWKQLISNVSNLVLTWISEHWSSIANFYTHNDKEWCYRQGRSTCLRSAGEYRGKPKILFKKDNQFCNKRDLTYVDHKIYVEILLYPPQFCTFIL